MDPDRLGIIRSLYRMSLSDASTFIRPVAVVRVGVVREGDCVGDCVVLLLGGRAGGGGMPNCTVP